MKRTVLCTSVSLASVILSGCKQPPLLVAPIADQTVIENAAPLQIDLAPVFVDLDSDKTLMIYAANSSATDLVTPRVDGTHLILNIHSSRFGKALITVTATSEGQSVSDNFELQVQETADGKVRVILMAGQSNMVGHGLVGELSYMVPALITPRQDVFIKSIISPNREFGPLQPGYGYSDNNFGVELRAGQVLGNMFDEPIYVYKAAQGGTTLARADHWRPLAYGGVSGNLYDQTISGFKRFVDTELVQKGIAYKIAGLVWFQGENDTFDGYDLTYEENLRNFLTAVRNDHGQPELPVVITQINDTWGESGKRVMAAQAHVAADDANATLVVTDDQRPYYHYGSDSFLVMGERIARAMTSLLKRPAAAPDVYTLTPGAPYNVTATEGVQVNDAGADLQARLITPTRHGSLNLQRDGAFRYVPQAGYIGTDTFEYVASAAGVSGNTAKVSLQVRDASSPLALYFSFDRESIDGASLDNALLDRASGVQARVQNNGVSANSSGRVG